MTACNIRFFRRILGVTKQDALRNIDIKEALGVKALERMIETRQLGWWGRLVRVSKIKIVKRIWKIKVKEKE